MRDIFICMSFKLSNINGNGNFKLENNTNSGNFILKIADLAPIPSPSLLFDFSQTAYYSNSGTSIADLSGNNNNGTFSVGTGNGSPSTVTGYNTNGYLSLPGTSAQYSVRLPDSLKPSGNNPFTFIVHFRPKGYSYNGVYPGILAHGDSDLGLSWYITSDGGGMQAVWRDLNSGDNGYNSLSYQGGLNNWTTYALTSNGYSHQLFEYYNNTLHSSSAVNTNRAITVQPTWGFFLGLRYNNWINADFNYVSIYNSYLTGAQIQTVAASLSSRNPI